MTFLYPNISPIVLKTIYINIYWYGFFHLLIFITNSLYFLRLKSKIVSKNKKRHLKEFFFFLLIGAIVGGKVGYIIFYAPEIFMIDNSTILKFWLPGRSFYGGLVGILALAIIYKISEKKIPLNDDLLLMLPINIFFIRIANFINGELYGRITNQEWGMIFPHIDNNLRHVSQLYEAFFEGILIFFIMNFMYKKKQKSLQT